MLCPLGFLRISTNRTAIGAPMPQARKQLEQFAKDRKVYRIADDLAASDSHPAKSEELPTCTVRTSLQYTAPGSTAATTDGTDKVSFPKRWSRDF